MENRRQFYRHRFRQNERLPVQLALPHGRTVQGVLVDLSIGGIAVDLPAPAPAPGPGAVTFTLGSEGEPITAPVEFVHLQTGEPPFLGFRFLTVASQQAVEDRDKKIWIFLMNEQRRARQLSLAG